MSETSGQPARYQRTFGGLIGSMVVLLLVVGAFVAFRAAVRTNPDQSPTAVDWADTVRAVDGSGDTLVHPDRVPSGWTVTSANYRPGSLPQDRRWDLGALLPGQRFMGLAQGGTTLADLVTTYVDPKPRSGAAVRLGGTFGGTWQTWTDGGGDYAVGRALTGALQGQYVVVFGTASHAQVRAYAESLTATPPAQPSASSSAP